MDARDVGVSYFVLGVAGTLSGYVRPPWQSRSQVSAVAALGVNAAVRPTFTEVGHLTAFIVGLAGHPAGARSRPHAIPGLERAMTRPPPPQGWYPEPDAAPTRLQVPQPQDDPLGHVYGQQPLPSIAPGTVLATRSIPYHILGIPTLLKTTQLLYRSTSQTGKPTVNVTSVIQPLNQGDRTKVISYQSAYDSLNRNDQPSYAISAD